MLVGIFPYAALRACRGMSRASPRRPCDDVTGRNLPRETNWAFVKAASHEDIPEAEETVRLLRSRGFYVIEK